MDILFFFTSVLRYILTTHFNEKLKYRNDPKFSDRLVWANSADPDQTAPRGEVKSGSPLLAISFASF